MEMPFYQLHEFYRIAYNKMEARMEAEKKEEEERKKEEERNSSSSSSGSQRSSTDVKQHNKPIGVSPSISMDDLEELIEDGG